MNKIADLLGTKKQKEQEQRLEQLVELARRPVFDLVIRFDGRKTAPITVQVIGDPGFSLDIQQTLGLLEQARLHLLALERQALASKQAGPGGAKDPAEIITDVDQESDQ